MSQTIPFTYSLWWFERFGNNIQQISNLILYALQYNVPAIIPDHKYINSFKINEHLETTNIRKNKFFNCWNFNGCNQWEDFTKKRHKIVREYIYPNLKFRNKDVNILNDDDLVIHIRSGDIFRHHSKGCSGRQKFVQNPLSFFQKIMEDYNKIYICSENRANPVLDILSKDNRVTTYIGRNIIDDILLILSSKNVCTGGIGTFAIACCMLSKNIKKFYSTNLDPKTFLNYHNIDGSIAEKYITTIDQSRYIRIGRWCNLHDQRQLMLEYKL